jgi:hypothetical protein
MSYSDSDLFEILSSLNCGTAETIGSVDRYGRHFERFEGPVTSAELLAEAERLGIELSADDADELAGFAGAVLSCDDAGFRSVDLASTPGELAELWTGAEEFVQARDDAARDELERSIVAELDATMPETWTIRHTAWTGCSAVPRPFESEEAAREAFRIALAELRAQGVVVHETLAGEPGAPILASAEIEDPEESLMVSDSAGVLGVVWNGPARAEELERRLDRAQEML